MMILIRNTFHVILRDDLNLSCEVLWIELHASHGEPVLFGVFYRPPSSDINVLQQLYVIHYMPLLLQAVILFFVEILMFLTLTGQICPLLLVLQQLFYCVIL